MIYSLAESFFIDEKGINHKTYGITAKDFNGNVSAAYPDIFFDKEQAESFVNLCNENKLGLCHLADAIEDALT